MTNKTSLFQLAVAGGQEILSARTETTMGVRFPAEPYEGSSTIRYDLKLYDGAAGIGIALLDLYLATGNSRFLDLSEEIAHGTIESTPEFAPLTEGLYSGFGGVVLFHLARAHLLGKADALDFAIQMGSRIAKNSYLDTDLMAGAAGRGLLHLALYYASRDSLFLDAAIQSASFLASSSTRQNPGVAWYVRDPRQPLTGKEHPAYLEIATQIHAGLAHGVAGIALFLSELSAIVGNPEITTLRDESYQWLDSNALRLDDGLVWTRSLTERSIQDHWCHGSTGIAHAYVAHYKNTGDPKAWYSAERAGRATWNAAKRNLKEPICHCHGLAGAIELFLDLHQIKSDGVWLQRAHHLAKRITARKLSNEGCGFSVGTAGIVRQLLRMCGHEVFSVPVPLRTQPRLKRPVQVARRKIVDKVNYFEAAPELVPLLAVQLPDAERFVAMPQQSKHETRRILKLIEVSPCGEAYFNSVKATEKACERLQQKYSRILHRRALSSASFGILLREIAAMTLHAEADARTVKSAAKRIVANSIAAIDRMLQRVQEDISTSLDEEVGGKLMQINIRSSDPHRGGERVIDLKFEEGLPLLYKARSMALDREFGGISNGKESPTLAELCRKWLRPAIEGGLLPTHRVIAAGPWHGYAETIQINANDTFSFANMPDGCDPPRVIRLNKGENRRYWYSAGLLAGFAFSLGIHDLHSENIVSGRTQSTSETSMHAVDLEMAFGNVIDLEDTHLINGPRWDGSPRPHTHSPLDFEVDPYCALYSENWAIEKRNGRYRFIERPFITARWRFPHLVQNSDATFGYRNYVCSFIRGFADQWAMMQQHRSAIAQHLKEKLYGAPMRVLFKATRSQFTALANRKMKARPVTGLAMNPIIPFALPYREAELQQLDNFDIPYFFKHLGGSEIFYFNNGKIVQDESIRTEEPFWSIVEKQAEPSRLARALVDIACAVAPADPFDFHDPSLGVRIIRTSEDQRLIIIVLMGQQRDQRMTCRVATDGSTEWWFES